MVQGGTSWGGKIDLWGITERVNRKPTYYGTTFTFSGANHSEAIVTNIREPKAFTIIGRCKGLNTGRAVPQVEFDHCLVPK